MQIVGPDLPYNAGLVREVAGKWVCHENCGPNPQKAGHLGCLLSNLYTCSCRCPSVQELPITFTISYYPSAFPTTPSRLFMGATMGGWMSHFKPHMKKGAHLPNKVIVLDLWWWFFVTRSVVLPLSTALTITAGHLTRQHLKLQTCPNGGLLVSLALFHSTTQSFPRL